MCLSAACRTILLAAHLVAMCSSLVSRRTEQLCERSCVKQRDLIEQCITWFCTQAMCSWVLCVEMHNLITCHFMNWQEMVLMMGQSYVWMSSRSMPCLMFSVRWERWRVLQYKPLVNNGTMFRCCLSALGITDYLGLLIFNAWREGGGGGGDFSFLFPCGCFLFVSQLIKKSEFKDF